MKLKTAFIIIPYIILILAGNQSLSYAQDTTNTINQNAQKLYLVTKNDGTEYIGFILKQDAREILIVTEDLGEVYIPKHEIKSIREISQKDINSGIYKESNTFYTRYFVTTNGLSMKKGDKYILNGTSCE